MTRKRAFRIALLALSVGLAQAVGGCATVKPWEKERLADRIMSFDEDAREAAEELHWIEAREGSTGGAGAAGGGCACN
jgi:hypothetical protein